jgi:hypothetical protein
MQSRLGLFRVNSDDAVGKELFVKMVICGGRDYIFGLAEIAWLDAVIAYLASLGKEVSEVVSGAARGADCCGEMWAKMRDIPIKRFPADWNTHGKSAGYRRNEEMAEYPEVCCVFPGGRGTSHMSSLSAQYGLKVFRFEDGVLEFE